MTGAQLDLHVYWGAGSLGFLSMVTAQDQEESVISFL